MLCRVFSQETVNKLEALDNVNKAVLYNNINTNINVSFKHSDKHMLRIAKRDTNVVEFKLYHYDDMMNVYRIDTHFFPVLTEEDLEKVIKFVDNIK